MAGMVTGVAANSSSKRSPRRPLSLATGRDLAEDSLNQRDSRTYRAKAGMDIEAWLRGLGLEDILDPLIIFDYRRLCAIN